MIKTKLFEILKSTGVILPEVVFIFGLLILVLIVAFDTKKNKATLYNILALALAGYLLISAVLNYEKLGPNTIEAYNGFITLDPTSIFFKGLIALAAIIMLVHIRLFDYKMSGEFYVVFFTLILGLNFLTMTSHFLVIFISLEMVSISTYVLVSIHKTKQNFEAGIKYLIFGATTTAIMLFGVSLFYGMTHQLNFSSETFHAYLQKNNEVSIQIVSFLFLGGLFFKAAAAPFHNWVPDVYESTPTPILSFISFAPKAVAIMLIARFIKEMAINLNSVILLVSVLSLIYGNFSALWQTNVKRMLGYSGIAQSGFILIGLIKYQSNDFYGAFFYMVLYLPITMGSFFLVDVLYKQVKSFEIEDYKGLGQKNFLLGLNAVIIMMALVGLPPTLGFLAKLVVFSSIMDMQTEAANSTYYALLIFGLLNAAVSIYYYLKVPYFMLVKTRYKFELASRNLFLTTILSVFSFVIVYYFFKPEGISQIVSQILFLK